MSQDELENEIKFLSESRNRLQARVLELSTQVTTAAKYNTEANALNKRLADRIQELTKENDRLKLVILESCGGREVKAHVDVVIPSSTDSIEIKPPVEP